MTVKAIVKAKTYFDSVSLMSLSTKANQIDGVEQAIIAMGTEMNKEVMKNVGLMTFEVEEAKSSDLIIVVNAANDEMCESAFIAIEELMTKRKPPLRKVKSNIQQSHPHLKVFLKLI